MPKDFLALDTNFPQFTGTETTDQKVNQLYNYTYMLLENLRYCLRNLDSRNFNEAGLREITDPIYARISDAEGNLTELAIEATGLALRVSNAEGDITSLTITAEGLQSQVSNIDGDVSSLQQTADSLTSRISNAEGDISSLTQTVNSFTLSVDNGETSSTLYLDAGQTELSSVVIRFTGVVVFSNLDGSSGTIIDGGAIDTDTLYLDSLYGNTIYLYDRSGDIGAEIQMTGAASAESGAFDLTSGALRFSAFEGDVFMKSYNGYVTLDGWSGVSCHGDFLPGANDRYNLGDGGLVWADIYAASGTINTSDREKKEAIVYGLYKLNGLLDKLEPCTFRFRDGTSGRSHAGFIAQDVEEALEELGLTTADFAGLVKSPREDGGYDYFLRYNEFIPINTWEIQKLKARVAELEARLGSQTEA